MFQGSQENALKVPQGCIVKVTSRLPQGSQDCQVKVVKVPKVAS